MNDSQDDDLRRVSQALEDLSEFFDTVQIFTTRYESAEIGTVAINKGIGNWYARRGQVNEWLIKEEEDIREQIRKPDNEA